MKVLMTIFSVFYMLQLFAFQDGSIDEKWLQKVWQNGISKSGWYYKFDLNGEYFHGTRDWNERWELIANAVSYEGKKVLELGSNIGICSTFLAKYMPIESTCAVEHSVRFTKKCEEIQRIFGVKYPVYVLDLDKHAYERILGKDYDIVICMSLYHWVHNKDRFMKYLSHFDKIVYEGHDSKEIEIARFAKVGITHYRLLGYGKKHRPVILFSKSPL